MKADNLSHHRSGQWIDRQMWKWIRQGLGEIGHAKKLKTHRRRMTALEKVAR